MLQSQFLVLIASCLAFGGAIGLEIEQAVIILGLVSSLMALTER